MGQLRQIAKHSSYYLIARVCMMALGFVSFPLFTRILSVEQYGLMGLATTVVLSVTTFSKFGMQHALQRFHRERSSSPHEFRRYFSTLFLGALAGTALITTTYVATLLLLPHSILSDVLRALLMAASVLILVRTVQSMISNLLLVEGRIIALNLLEIASKVTLIAVVCFLLLHWQRTALAYIVGMAMTETAVLAATLPYILKRGLVSFGDFDTVFWQEAFFLAFPMIGAELGAIVLDTGDRFLVQHYLGPTALGLYAAAYGLAQYAWELMVVPIGAVFFPMCMDCWVQRGPGETQRLLSNSLRYFLVPAIWLLCLAVLGSRDVIVILASRKYQSAYTLLPVLVAGMVAAAIPVFFRAGLLIMKKSGSVAFVTGVAIMSNIVLNIVLIPRIGLRGAAIATFLSYAIQAVLTACLSLRALPFVAPYGAAAKYLGCAGLTAIMGLQVKLANPWAELAARMGVALVYPALLWILDEHLRSASRNLLQRRRETVTSVVC